MWEKLFLHWRLLNVKRRVFNFFFYFITQRENLDGRNYHNYHVSEQIHDDDECWGVDWEVRRWRLKIVIEYLKYMIKKIQKFLFESDVIEHLHNPQPDRKWDEKPPWTEVFICKDHEPIKIKDCIKFAWLIDLYWLNVNKIKCSWHIKLIKIAHNWKYSLLPYNLFKIIFIAIKILNLFEEAYCIVSYSIPQVLKQI